MTAKTIAELSAELATLEAAVAEAKSKAVDEVIALMKEHELTFADLGLEAPKRPGRPKGSKSKPKAAAVTEKNQAKAVQVAADLIARQ